MREPTLTEFDDAHNQATMATLAAIKVAADLFVTPGKVDKAGVRKRAAECVGLLAAAFQCLMRVTK